MTYTVSVPNSGDSLGSTRALINANFGQIDAANSINHVDFNAANEGKHKFLQMPEVTVSGAGVPTTAADEGAVYTDVAQNVTNLFFRPEGSGTAIPLTTAGFTAPIGAAGSFSAFGVAVGNITGADLGYSLNLSTPNGVEKLATGSYRITFGAALNSANYIVNFNFVDDTGIGQKDLHAGKIITSTRATTGFDLETRRTGNQASDDPRQIMFVCIGG